MRFIDSNVFAYHLAGDRVFGARAKSILEAAEEGERSCTSTLAISQVCGYLKWRKRNESIPVFLALLRSLTSLMKIETTIGDFVEAIDLQTEHNLSWSMWDDLVIAAQMRRLKILEIYSNDSDFDGIPWIKRLF